MSDIKKTGMSQGDLVSLLNGMQGKIYIPFTQFSDIGNATAGAVGSSKPTGLAFDKTTAEEADTHIVLPDNVDVSKAMTIKVYWSSADTAGGDAIWDIDYIARASGEDIGATVTNLTTTDTDSTTADALNISDALTIPASTLASTDELLYLNLRREAAASGDTLDADATFYGISIAYTSTPSIEA